MKSTDITNDDILEGIKIISKYIPDGHKQKCDFNAEEDSLSFGKYEWVTDQNDRNKLEELGWNADPKEAWFINFRQF